MIKQIIFLTLFAFIFSPFATISATISATTSDLSIETYIPDDMVFMDDENSICFIDLMSIDILVQKVTLWDTDGHQLDEINCLNKAVREIIEFDMVNYNTGRYILKFETVDDELIKQIKLM